MSHLFFGQKWSDTKLIIQPKIFLQCLMRCDNDIDWEESGSSSS